MLFIIYCYILNLAQPGHLQILAPLTLSDCRSVFNRKLKWLYLSHFLLQRLEIWYGKPLGVILSTEHRRFYLGYLQIPYLQIHAAFCRYNLKSYISVISCSRDLKFCMVNTYEPTLRLRILNFIQDICRYLICRYMLLFVDTIVTRQFLDIES